MVEGSAHSSPNHIDWECELAVVIGQRCKGVQEADALKVVAGYTVIVDVSDRQFGLVDVEQRAIAWGDDQAGFHWAPP